MLDVNNTTLTTPFYRRLSEDQLQALHGATLEIMQRTGVRFDHQEAIELLRKRGAQSEGVGGGVGNEA